MAAAVCISIHALREEGDHILRYAILSHRISIHALREEGDDFVRFDSVQFSLFLSTPSVRRATVCLAVLVQHGLISIHALREEGD